jgi:triacylglycerol lipase
MPFTNAVAASYGFLSMYAMDMYRVGKGVTPDPATGLTAAGWQILGYITGSDTAFRSGLVVIEPEIVYYGFVAQKGDEISVVIRGTDGLVEWIEDAEFRSIPYTPDEALPSGYSEARVEEGFWNLYGTLDLVDPNGQTIGALFDAVQSLGRPATQVKVVGHSLGASLASYLTLDLARGPLGKKIQACFFASPHVGNVVFASLFDSAVANYHVFNYVFDVVPRLPFGPGYCVLTKHTVIMPGDAEAQIRMELACNHHVVCYCAMLDYAGTQAAITPVPAGEQHSIACILGPETGQDTVAKKILADLLP